jgi:hypothetical protein
MQLTRTRLVTGIAAATLPLALLAGCGEDEPTPKFEKPSSSPTASPSPDEPVKPTPPAAMEGDDVEAAKAFVEYYFETATYAVLTGKVNPVKRLASPDCVGCRGLHEAITMVYEKGGVVTGGEMRATDVQMAAKDLAAPGVSAFGGRFSLRIAKQVIRGTGDSSIDGPAASLSTPTEIQVLHTDSGWTVAEWNPA